MKIYHYPACSTCKKALKFLDARGIPYRAADIVKTPPSKTELAAMLKAKNTSGEVYREMGLKDRIGSMSAKEAIDLLAANGKLVKRPFVIADGRYLLGFVEDEWKAFGQSSTSPRR